MATIHFPCDVSRRRLPDLQIQIPSRRFRRRIWPVVLGAGLLPLILAGAVVFLVHELHQSERREAAREQAFLQKLIAQRSAFNEQLTEQEQVHRQHEARSRKEIERQEQMRVEEMRRRELAERELDRLASEVRRLNLERKLLLQELHEQQVREATRPRAQQSQEKSWRDLAGQENAFHLPPVNNHLPLYEVQMVRKRGRGTRTEVIQVTRGSLQARQFAEERYPEYEVVSIRKVK